MSFPTPDFPCPYCGFKNNAVTGPDLDPPKVGDLAICANCIEASLFDEGMRPRKPTAQEAEELASDPLVTQAKYATQITAMVMNGKRWVREHPGQDLKIQFNIPAGVHVIQTISEAVKKHTISTTPAGLELLKALWSWDDVKEPTVFMVKTAIDFLMRGLDKK